MTLPDPQGAARRRQLVRVAAVAGAVALAAVVLVFATRAPAASPRAEDKTYDVAYSVGFLPEEGQAAVTITVEPGTGEVRQLRLRMPPARYPAVTGDGTVVREGDVVVWTPERGRAQALRYRVVIDDRRAGGAFDARMGRDWVIVRGDTLVPRMSVRTTRGADSRTRLAFVLPDGWKSVDTPYRRARDGEAFVVADPERNFDRPLGWIVAGRIGVRRESIRGTQVSVAGPTGDDLRRLDMLSYFNLLIPEFRKAFGDLPPKLLVVTAGDPMWRGGLSGPRSLFIHASRPLVSENGTSTLVHEMTHVVTRLRGADGADWIAEGLAEFYSIELPRRSGLLSDRRARKAFAWMADHGRGVQALAGDHARGETTARAVQLFHELDEEIRAGTGGDKSLDDVVRALMPHREVSIAQLRAESAAVLGSASKVLAAPLAD